MSRKDIGSSQLKLKTNFGCIAVLICCSCSGPLLSELILMMIHPFLQAPPQAR